MLGILDEDTRNDLLKVRNLTLKKCIDICRAAEHANVKHKAIKAENPLVNKINVKKLRKSKTSTKRSSTSKTSDCLFCTTQHVLKKEECPAYGRQCSNCLQFNHYASKCTNSQVKKKVKSKVKSKSSRMTKVNQIRDDDDDDSYSSSTDGEFVNSCELSDTKSKVNDVKCRMLIGRSEVDFQIDTGAAVNILPLKYAKNVQKTSKVLCAWNKSKVAPLGVCRRNIVNPRNNRKYNVEFVVVDDEFTPLLGLKASEHMKLVSIREDNFERVLVTQSSDILDTYSDVMTDKLGKFSGEQHLNVDENVQPVVMPNRRVPLSLRSKLKDELDRLVDLKVIEPMDEPTPWISQLVIASKKNGDIRICLDPKELNQALLREHFTLPILEDTLHELGQSKVFTKADLSSGYWHIVLDEESSKLTTFQTCFGRYKWLRLPFGLNVSSEIFQKRILDCFSGLSGIVCIADDIVIHGKTIEEHDKNLELFLQRCRENNVVLNKDKLVLRTDSITFMGHIVTKDGLKSDPEKIQAIRDFPVPTKVDELRRFLGLVNYMSKFLPNATDVLHPLHNLLKKDVTWTWSESQSNSFQSIKDMIVNSPMLYIYDPSKELILENDASEYGLGSALMQEGRPVAFSSRALSNAEKNYAQIEKEMLAIVNGLTKFHHFTFGRFVRVLSDHKPLVSIVKKPLFRAPKRLQAMLLRLQEYNFEVEYRPGNLIPISDALSRAPTSKPIRQELISVNNLSFSPAKEHRLQEIRDKTNADDSLQMLKKVIMKGWPCDKTLVPKCITPYFDYRDELTVQDGIILRGERLVIPTSMRSEMKNKIHSGHSGINSCLRRAREFLFWPNISAEVRQFVESCDICSSFCTEQAKEPLYLHETPSRPWEKVGTDIFKFKGRHYLITVDYFSQFFEVDFLAEINSETVITKLKHHFCRYGIPDVVISDNGPQYTSHEFHNFAKKYGFSHEPISPGNSQSNGAAEAAVKIAKNVMKKCHRAKEDPYLGLLNVRNTPNEGMETSPVQRLLGRRTKTAIPTIPERLKPVAINFEKERRDKERKSQSIADRYVNRKELPPLKVGDVVRMQPIQNRTDEWKEAIVSKRLKNRSYEVTVNGRKYRRNRRYLRSSTESRKEKPNVRSGVTSYLVDDMSNEIVIPNPSDNTNETSGNTNGNNDNTVITRSGRISKPPDRLNL